MTMTDDQLHSDPRPPKPRVLPGYYVNEYSGKHITDSDEPMAEDQAITVAREYHARTGLFARVLRVV
jgi:hypothetical protein